MTNFFRFRVLSLFVICFLLLGVYFLLNTDSNSVPKGNFVKVAGQNIKVDLATTPEAQARGLSGRASLGEDQGMLFVFEKPGRYNFWMKDMLFPIDMIWLGEDLQVVYIKKNATPADGLKTFGPNQDAMYVLEVVSGFADKYGLKEGDQAAFIME